MIKRYEWLNYNNTNLYHEKSDIVDDKKIWLKYNTTNFYHD